MNKTILVFVTSAAEACGWVYTGKYLTKFPLLVLRENNVVGM